ncbi:MAG: alanine racemase [Kofleriaceae bacterium]
MTESSALSVAAGSSHATGADIRPTAVEVELAAVVDNARTIAQFTGTRVCAVVKADAYGHGAPMVAAALEDAGVVDRFAVSLVEEGLQLREAGLRAPVLVMGPSQAGGVDAMVAAGLTPVMSAAADLGELGQVASRRGRAIAVHLKVDTGMSRIGVQPAEVPAVVERARACGVRVVGAMTHLADADVDDPADRDSPTWRQLAAFEPAIAAMRAAGAPIEVVHAANSSGAMLFPPARGGMVRVGLALYGNGSWATDHGLPQPRRQALRFVTRIVQLRRVEAGARIGYGGLYTTTRPSVLGVLPVGYADGLPRRVTGHGQVIVAGRRCPTLGAVSMDMVVVDVTDLPGVAIGDVAVVLGSGRGRYGQDHIAVAELAAWTGLTEYEVTCGISKRVPRLAT